MDQLPLSRIAVETEPDWLRVQDNVSRGIMQAMEARLSSLAGGSHGDAATKVRKELEGRLIKVRRTKPHSCHHDQEERLRDCSATLILLSRCEKRCFRWPSPTSGSTATTTRISLTVSITSLPLFRTLIRIATEPFDEMLDRRIWSLDAERLEWDTTIAQKRKRTPGDIYRLEEDLERRQTGSEYLPEGEDEEEDGQCGRQG